MAKAKAKEEVKEENPIYGIEPGEAEMNTGGRFPYLRPKEGDRVRFHFLTSGGDPWLVATKFHSIGSGMQTRNIVCVSALTRGEETCTICEMDGGQRRRNMFGMWIMVDYILHPNDNPDEEGDSWEQKKLKIMTGAGEKQRLVFMEKMETELADDERVPGVTKVMWLPAGRGKIWWSQYSNAWMQSGDLRKHQYELHRTGSGRDDTNYTLNTLKEDPVTEELLGRDDVKDLPTIEEVFRSTLGGIPSSNGVMGTDEMDSGGEVEELPKAETKSEAESVATDGVSDLI